MYSGDIAGHVNKCLGCEEYCTKMYNIACSVHLVVGPIWPTTSAL